MLKHLGFPSAGVAMEGAAAMGTPSLAVNEQLSWSSIVLHETFYLLRRLFKESKSAIFTEANLYSSWLRCRAHFGVQRHVDLLSLTSHHQVFGVIRWIQEIYGIKLITMATPAHKRNKSDPFVTPTPNQNDTSNDEAIARAMQQSPQGGFKWKVVVIFRICQSSFSKYGEILLRLTF